MVGGTLEEYKTRWKYAVRWYSCYGFMVTAKYCSGYSTEGAQLRSVDGGASITISGGSINIKASSVNIDAANVNIGSSTVIDGHNFVGHTHGGVTSGGSNTGGVSG